MAELRYPVGSKLPSLVGGVYDDVSTRVWARVEDDEIVCPVPRPRFMALALREAFGLADGFVDAHVAASRRIGGDLRMDAAAGEAWWRYVRARGALRVAWPSADVVVPDVLLFASRDDGSVTRVMVWPEDASAIVVPDAADWIALKPSTVLMLPRPPRPVGLLAREAVVSALGERAERAPREPVPHRLYRGGEEHAGTLARLRGLPSQEARAFRAVRPDEVVDA